MKVKNLQMVTFLNNVNDILKLRIPRKLYTAISLNADALDSPAKVYSKLYDDIIGDAKAQALERQELLDDEVEVTIQTVTTDMLDEMDANKKFDALTGAQYVAIGFMISDD